MPVIVGQVKTERFQPRLVYRDGAPPAVVEGEFVCEPSPIEASPAASVSRVLRTRRPAAQIA